MPEGSEVTVTAEQLSELISGSKLLDTNCLDDKKCPKNFNKFSKDLPLKVDTVSARGKILYIVLSNKSKGIWWCLWCAFAMTGKFTIDPNKSSHTKYVFRFKGKKILKSGQTITGIQHVPETTYYTPANNFIIPKCLNGQREFNVYFESVRGFSSIKLLSSQDELSKKLSELKYSFLQDPELTLKVFNCVLDKYPRKNISTLLLDAHIFSGIGNYVLAEALYRAKISPFRKTCSLTDLEVSRLYKALQFIFKWSYLSQGGLNRSILPDVKVPKRVFSFAVYRQDRDPKGNKVTHEKIPGGRTGHWVKTLQK